MILFYHNFWYFSIFAVKIALERFISAPLPKNADWHLFICTKIRISKKWGKRRKTKKTRENLGFFGWHLFCQHVLEATPGFEPGDKGFADLCLTTWLCRLMSQPLPHPVDRMSKTTFILILHPFWAAYWLKHGYTICVPVLERITGLEPATSTLARSRSTKWAKSAYGASGRNRTNDTGIFSPLLYQLSYRGIQQGL